MGIGDAGATSSGWPQSSQNRTPGRLEAPQEVQVRASGEPQIPQNRFPTGTRSPQLAQVILSPSIAPLSYHGAERSTPGSGSVEEQVNYPPAC